MQLQQRSVIMAVEKNKSVTSVRETRDFSSQLVSETKRIASQYSTLVHVSLYLYDHVL
jgi:hypothetical protein